MVFFMLTFNWGKNRWKVEELRVTDSFSARSSSNKRKFTSAFSYNYTYSSLIVSYSTVILFYLLSHMKKFSKVKHMGLDWCRMVSISDSATNSKLFNLTVSRKSICSFFLFKIFNFKNYESNRCPKFFLFLFF